ncbi:MAG: carbon storage regulator, partial [Caulobacteraceae bacterium]|nr:carbon storage regulator [Caulobacteraceae bacterium]
MLVLGRVRDERILIGDDVTVTVVRVDGNQVRLGITAPTGTRIIRAELEPRQVVIGANSEKRTEDIGSAPGALSRKDAEAILRWRDDLDNTRFPVDLQAIV